MSNPTDYLNELRAWQRRLCEYLGLDPEQVFRVDDAEQTAASGIVGVGRIPAGWTVTYEATDPQTPSMGTAEPPRWFRDSENPPAVESKVWLNTEEWDEVIDAIGPKPQLLTREQELILKGLAAEARAD